jgi:hypothetical protein
MKIRLGILAALLCMSAPAAYAVPSDFDLFQDTGSQVNVIFDGSPFFTCSEPTAGNCFFTEGPSPVLPAQTNFNFYADAAHTILTDTLSMSLVFMGTNSLVDFEAGGSQTALSNAVDLTVIPGLVVDLGEITSSDGSTKPLDIEFQSTAPVPEPFTLSLFGAGVAGAVALRRRKKAQKA